MGQIVQKAWIKPSQSEPYSPWQNRAEIAINAIKKAVHHTTARTQAPSHLWVYCTLYLCELNNLMARPLFILHCRTPFECLTHNTPDISEYTDYARYDTIWYYDQKRKSGK